MGLRGLGHQDPSIKEELGLSDGALALAILGLEAGAIVGLPVGGALVARVGSRRALQLGFAGYPTALFAVALTSGLADAGRRVGGNGRGHQRGRCGHERSGGRARAAIRAAGVVQPACRASVRPGGGGVAGTAAAATGISVTVHFAAVAAVALVVAMVGTTVLLREPTREGQPAFVRPSRRLMLLGFIAFCAFLLDGVAYNWSAVHLRTQYDGSVGLAAAGFTVFAGALAIGRLFGDPLVARWGEFGSCRAVGPWPRSAAAWPWSRPPRVVHRGLGGVRARARSAGPDRARRGGGSGRRPTRGGDRRRHDDRLPRIVHLTTRGRSAGRTGRPHRRAGRAGHSERVLVLLARPGLGRAMNIGKT